MGLALLIIDPLWTHVRPLMDYRPNQVPLQRWQNQEGGPPPITPQGWRLRDAKPNKHCMGQVSCCMVVVQLSKTCVESLSNMSFALATVENMHQGLNMFH
jgi:hypothetical protein